LYPFESRGFVSVSWAFLLTFMNAMNAVLDSGIAIASVDLSVHVLSVHNTLVLSEII